VPEFPLLLLTVGEYIAARRGLGGFSKADALAGKRAEVRRTKGGGGAAQTRPSFQRSNAAVSVRLQHECVPVQRVCAVARSFHNPTVRVTCESLKSDVFPSYFLA
jgi:hypothetical protein